MTLLPGTKSRITNALSDRSRSHRRQTLLRRRFSQPRLELLEERTLLNVDMVENSNDSGAGSLRDTIANATAGDTIEFDMSAGHVTSQIVLTGGELSLSANLTIVGPGATSLSISGNAASAVFNIQAGVTAAISGLSIDSGSSAGNGGDVENAGDLPSLSACTVSSGIAAGDGGGIENDNSGMLTLTGCTVAGNSSSNDGGGIDNAGTLTLINSTIAGNSASSGSGGGLSNAGTDTSINCTVALNTAFDGGGIGAGGTLTLGNSIVADNSLSGAGLGPDFFGEVTADSGNNLIGDSSGSIGFTQPTDLLDVDPLLSPLGNYGGTTPTFALDPGSPAIDAGNNALVPEGVATDQRGFARIVNGTVDIGAFEVQLYLVLNTSDHGAGSLRTAMTNANQAGGSTILFATSGTILLQSALPAIGQNVDMVGPGATVLTIDGDATYQDFLIQPGVTAAISGLTIDDGFASSNGGDIENEGGLSLSNCTISTGIAGNDGGGIENDGSGTLTLSGCTVSGNATSNDGGGIGNDGTLTVINSTIANNAASSGVGGGLSNAGTVTLINSTVALNTAFDGGGLSAGGTQILANTIVAENSLSGEGSGPDFFGAVTTDSGNNLIGDSSGSAGFTQPSDLLDIDPLLSPLGFYGGTTETMTLLPGSPAIDAGGNALAFFQGNPLAIDQRGLTRLVNGTVDIGAVECQGFTITIVSGNNQQSGANTTFSASLGVLVTSLFGEPVTGGVITYGAPGSGASATFPGGMNFAITNSIGLARISATANTVVGSYSIGASTRGAAPTSFSLTNVAGAATQLAIQTQPSAAATAGAAFSTQPVIYLEDAYGNLETGDNTSEVTASLGAGTGPLEGTTTVTVSGGIATFTNLADDTAETITLHFTSVPVLAAVTSNDVIVSPAAASQLVIQTEPSASATAGTVFATQPVVYEEDQYGNLETGDSTTQVSAQSLPGGSGLLQGTTTVTVSGGIATFTNLADDKAETITLQLTSSPVLTAATSSNVVVSPAAATQLAIHTQPSVTAMMGMPFSTQPVVYVEDQFGNIETGDSTTQVTASSLPIGSGPLQGMTTVTVSGGVATFTNLADDNVETITLHFTSSPVLAATTSTSVAVYGPATQLVIHTQPSSTATAGSVFSTQPVVYVEDQFGNLETSDNTTQVTASSLPGGSSPCWERRSLRFPEASLRSPTWRTTRQRRLHFSSQARQC